MQLETGAAHLRAPALRVQKLRAVGQLVLLAMFGVGLAACSSSSTPRNAAALQLSHNNADAGALQNQHLLGPRKSLAKPKVDPVTRTVASPRIPTRRIPLGGGYAKTGKPYRIGTRWYYPKKDRSYDRTGTASWYGTAFHGRKTANGEYFDMNRLTAAHPTLPLPSYVMVTNLANKRSVVVRVNDRGPYAHNRLIDLSRETARRLDFEHKGTAKVRVRWIGKAPLDGNERFEQAFLQRQPWYRRQLARK